MSPEEYERIETALGRVLEADADQREAIITQLCVDDPELEERIRKLVSLDDSPTEQGLLGDAAIEKSRRELDELLDRPPGPTNAESEYIGPFRIIREIGRGGMGVVYECQQAQPRRRVAVKIVDSLVFGRELSKRLQAESQIQGQLRHPGIARVYDAGVAKFGRSHRPYFVMELIDGQPLSVYADSEKLSMRERLALIALVADGMMHAHERGVIHRDLKPDNILVERDGQPKILDFGIARFMSDSTLAATMMTGEGQILGTLAYMAPEQLAGSPDLITPRTDVYALGAIAYELVSGHPPLAISGMSLSAAIRSIEIDDPLPLRARRDGIARDAETIISRCLHRDPALRFANAGELAADIRRFLADLPVVSRRPTPWYRTRKFVRRNRLLVAGVGATMLTLLLGILAAGHFAAGQHAARVEAEQEQRRARSKELEAIQGVLGGAKTLAESGKLWDAVSQLHTVDPESRGWEWRHIALSAPWIIETHRLSRADTTGRTGIGNLGFVGEFTLLEHDPWLRSLHVVDLITGERRTLPQVPAGIRKPQPLSGIVQSSILVQTNEDHIGQLDLVDGSYTQLISAGLANGLMLRSVSHDGSIVVLYERETLAIIRDGQRVFEMNSGLGDASPEHWNAPAFSPSGDTVYLARWGNPGVIIAVDTTTWTVRHRADTRSFSSEIAVSGDGQVIYCTSLNDGIQKYRASDLEPIGSIDAADGWTQTLSISADGRLLTTGFNKTSELRVYDTKTEQIVYSANFGASHLHRKTKFSPSGRLLHAVAPTRTWTWLIDLDAPHDGGVTWLEGHRSWVYQLAISRDGSLLASAEPETGEVTLWDLTRGRALARFARDRNPAWLSAHMNAPLYFGRNTPSLVFGEVNAELGRVGLTAVNLLTGERSWTETGTYEKTLDAAADAIGTGPMFHHAAALPDGRILQSNGSPAIVTQVVVRGRTGSTTHPPKVLEASSALRGGVAVHPRGTAYASGEYLMVRIRDSETDEVIAEIPDGAGSTVYGMTYSPDGTRFAMGTEDGRVLIYDTEFYTRLASIRAPRAPQESDRNYIFNLAWTPDNKRLVTCGGTSIRVFESERPSVRREALRAWEIDLDAARSLVHRPGYETPGHPSAAEFVAIIEAWAGSESEDTQN